MKLEHHVIRTLLALLLVAEAIPAVEPKENAFPPGWVPINLLDDRPKWADFRKIDDKVHLYLPRDEQAVRGVFVCYVFHSQDPRELADLWNFALVTVPWPFEYDLGYYDRRNGRHKLGHPVGNAGRLLDYLKVAAAETKHPELTEVPIVGWLGQNGPVICADLFKRAPQRVLAWVDGFPNWVAKYPELTSRVPFAYAWEFTPGEEKERRMAREKRLEGLAVEATSPADLSCRANTYGFPHGIYSKFSFFASFLDRCIAQRVSPGAPRTNRPFKAWVLEDGWAGDYNEIGAWNSIAPVRKAKGMVAPQWLPDEYAAWMWRAYHSRDPEIKLTSPVIEYRKKDGKWGGPECGLGYGAAVSPSTSLDFAADTKSEFHRVEFRSGDKVLGTVEHAPWKLEGVKLERGLHALLAVGVRKDGTRTISRAAFLVVK